MNWNAIGAIGQILGSAAVFVTIGFLVIQVRDDGAETQRAAVWSRTEANNQGNWMLATNERLVALHGKADLALDPDGHRPPFIDAAITKLGFTVEEAAMVYAELLARWNVTAQSVIYRDRLPAGDRQQLERGIRATLSEPIYRLWYDLQKSNLNPDAIRYVDRLLATPDPISAIQRLKATQSR